MPFGLCRLTLVFAMPIDSNDDVGRRSGETVTAGLLRGELPRRNYDNPPVVEAAARFHWNEPMPWNLTTPGRLFERIKEDYPAEPQFQNSVQAELGLTDGEGAPNLQVTTGPQRVVFGNEDRTRLLIVGATDLSVHGLRPYEGWESLEERLFSAFRSLKDFVPNELITQLGLRYINRIEIPDSSIEIGEYMTISFSMPDGWPARISAFLDRAEFVYPDGDSRISFTWATTESEPGGSAFIVDLDLVRDLKEPTSVDEARAAISELKARETAAFESLIQDRLRGLFRESK